MALAGAWPGAVVGGAITIPSRAVLERSEEMTLLGRDVAMESTGDEARALKRLAILGVRAMMPAFEIRDQLIRGGIGFDVSDAVQALSYGQQSTLQLRG